jgi:hypothetical protein
MRVTGTFRSCLAPCTPRLWKELFLQVVGYVNHQLRPSYPVIQPTAHTRKAVALLRHPQRRPTICAGVIANAERKGVRMLKIGQHGVYSDSQPLRQRAKLGLTRTRSRTDTNLDRDACWVIIDHAPSLRRCVTHQARSVSAGRSYRQAKRTSGCRESRRAARRTAVCCRRVRQQPLLFRPRRTLPLFILIMRPRKDDKRGPGPWSDGGTGIWGPP